MTLPLAMPGIVTGAVFAFATSLDEVVLTLFVAGPNQRTLARQMFSSIRENISPTVAAAAFLLIVGTLLLAALAALLQRRSPKKPGAAPALIAVALPGRTIGAERAFGQRPRAETSARRPAMS